MRNQEGRGEEEVVGGAQERKAQFRPLEEATSPEELIDLVKKGDEQGTSYGLKKIARTLESMIKKNKVDDLAVNIFAANLSEIASDINAGKLPDFSPLDDTPDPEFSKQLKESAAWDLLLRIDSRKTLDDIVSSLEEANRLADGAIPGFGDAEIKNAKNGIEAVRRQKELAGKVLKSTLQRVPEDFGLRNLVTMKIGSGNITEA